jgi:hypothetical protein
VRVKVVFSDTLGVPLVPVTVMVYVPFGASVEVVVVVVVVLPPLLPQPATASVSAAKANRADNMGQRRRRRPGKPIKTSDRRVAPLKARVARMRPEPLRGAASVDATVKCFTAADTQALDDVKTVIAPAVVAVGLV